MSTLRAPNGKEIVGTSETLPATAFIQSATRNPDGTFEIEYSGETKCHWDGQYTNEDEDERLFVDTDGQEWRESQLTLDETETERPEVPAGFPVRPLAEGDPATDRVTCGECGRSWDDAIPTSYTPAPSARCPFEAYH
jgi:hypothetical protein